MTLYDGMLLYHGSYTAVDNIDLEMCTEGKDFGRGFYMTSSQQQARRFIAISLVKAKSTGRVPQNQTHGYVSTFQLHLNSDVRIYEFAKCSEQWLWFISLNRRARLADSLAPLVSSEILQAEIVVGKVANDTTNPVITTYLNGLYGDITSQRAINFAIEELLPDHLVDQICFRTEQAIGHLEYKETIRYG